MEHPGSKGSQRRSLRFPRWRARAKAEELTGRSATMPLRAAGLRPTLTSQRHDQISGFRC